MSFTGAGQVVSTWPSAGTQVVTSTPVTVHYALSSRDVVEVPDVVGEPEWRARLALRAAGLLVGQVTYVQDPAQPQGVVEV
ncbi:MAG: PASTA domain-containing protein, partial [Symbiobacteriaceae bacterium]